MDAFDIIQQYFPALASGTRTTLTLAANAWAIGLVAGLISGMLAYTSRVVSIFLHALSFIALSVPFLVWIYWAHFPFQEMLGVVIDPFVTASILLGALNAIAVAEVWRNALSSFGNEYLLVARMSGLSTIQAMRYIQLPLAFRQALPMLLALQVGVLQLTLFASLISVNELFRVAQRINSAIYKPIEIYTTLAIFFLLLCAPLYILAYWLRRKYVEDYSELGRET